MKYSYFLCDKSKIKRKYYFNVLKIIYAMGIYLKFSKKKLNTNSFLKIIEKCEFIYSKKKYKITQNIKSYNINELIYIGLKITAIMRFVGHVFNRSDICLNRSISLGAVLLYMCIPCNIIIAKANYALNNQYQFHSWVEINGIPINDSIGVKSQWKTIYKF